MQAISVRYIPPSNHRGAYYVAEAPAGRIRIKLGNIPDNVEHYRYAAETLCRKFGWTEPERGALLQGTLSTGAEVFVFDHPLSRKED